MSFKLFLECHFLIGFGLVCNDPRNSYLNVVPIKINEILLLSRLSRTALRQDGQDTQLTFHVCYDSDFLNT